MRIGKVEFPYAVFCAPGARGFFGEGYPFHRLSEMLGMTWKGTNFVSKTTTRYPHIGNMPLRKDGITPREFLPACITIKPLTGHVLNAVGLSGPGAVDLFERGLWQKLSEPFVLSFMAIGTSQDERLDEYRLFRNRLKGYLHRRLLRKENLVLQLNLGCPNTTLSLENLYDEQAEALAVMKELDLTLTVNFNPLVPVALLRFLQDTGLCDGFWVCNTIPYDRHSLGEKVFGKKVSPLVERGFSAGGISGPACLSFTAQTIKAARKAGVVVPIIGGNGIQWPRDVEVMKEAGASGISIGVVAMMRPWQMRRIITQGNTIFGRQESEKVSS